MLFNRVAIGRAILVSLVLSMADVAAASEQPPTLTIGSALPAFSLPGIDGKTYTDQSFKDANILVIVFTCAHCPTAQAYQERIKKLVTDYSPKGVKLVAINPNHPDSVRLDELAYSDLSDSFDEMKERAKQEKFNFVWLDDGPKQVLGHLMGPVATPHVFIFDKARKLRFEGRIDDSERESLATSFDTRNALDALVAGKEPPVTSTRVFGCSVKWADKVAEYAKFKERWAAEPVTARVWRSRAGRAPMRCASPEERRCLGAGVATRNFTRRVPPIGRRPRRRSRSTACEDAARVQRDAAIENFGRKGRGIPLLREIDAGAHAGEPHRRQHGGGERAAQRNAAQFADRRRDARDEDGGGPGGAVSRSSRRARAGRVRALAFRTRSRRYSATMAAASRADLQGLRPRSGGPGSRSARAPCPRPAHRPVGGRGKHGREKGQGARGARKNAVRMGITP